MKNKEFIKKYSSMDANSISAEIKARKTKINDLIFDAVKGKIKNVREIKRLRREVAKLSTFSGKEQI